MWLRSAQECKTTPFCRAEALRKRLDAEEVALRGKLPDWVALLGGDFERAVESGIVGAPGLVALRAEVGAFAGRISLLAAEKGRLARAGRPPHGDNAKEVVLRVRKVLAKIEADRGRPGAGGGDA